MIRPFYTPASFGGSPSCYNLLPFRFCRLDDDELLVNEAGEYLFAPLGTASALAHHTLSAQGNLYKTLKAKQFVWDAESSPLLDVLATKYRTKKSFLDNGPMLHIIVLTRRCDNSCRYCQITSQSRKRRGYDMTPETARRVLDLILKSPGEHLTIEFQGGEPLLNYATLQYTIETARALAAQHGKLLTLVVATNLARANDEILSYFRDREVKISTSLDGPQHVHNANRPRHGEDSYEVTIDRIARARQYVGVNNVSALMTTTKYSLRFPRDIIDEYVAQGFQTIFLRSLSPYGFAANNPDLSYTADEFVRFYATALDYIIELNRRGTFIAEIFATILLTKILTPYPTGYVDLQSPCGAGNTVLVYNHDGGVYPSDEARMLAAMGDDSFRLGSVYDPVFNSTTSAAYEYLMSASCNEALPGCAECAFQSFCASDPVRCHASQGDVVGSRPMSEFCRKHRQIITHLFRILRTADAELLRIFFRWLGSTPESRSEICD